MAYQAWSVIAGEQPTAAKWNILGTNDAFFNDEITALSALFGDVTETTNGGSGGGTLKYAIIGNLALAFGISSQSGNISNGASFSCGIAFPAGLFAAAPVVSGTTYTPTTSANTNVYFSSSGGTATSMTILVRNNSGSTITTACQWQAIGIAGAGV